MSVRLRHDHLHHITNEVIKEIEEFKPERIDIITDENVLNDLVLKIQNANKEIEDLKELNYKLKNIRTDIWVHYNFSCNINFY